MSLIPRHKKRFSLRVVLLVVLAGSLVGWSSAIVAGYYLLRVHKSDPQQLIDKVLAHIRAGAGAVGYTDRVTAPPAADSEIRSGPR